MFSMLSTCFSICYSWDIVLFAQIISIAHSIGNWQVAKKHWQINVQFYTLFKCLLRTYDNTQASYLLIKNIDKTTCNWKTMLSFVSPLLLMVDQADHRKSSA